jgi:hypothetical protein
MLVAPISHELDTVLVPPRPKPRLVSVAAAARELQLHESTIRNYLTHGLVKRYKTPPGAPGRVLVDLNELENLRKNPPAAPVED